jgi:hypothetical protein
VTVQKFRSLDEARRALWLAPDDPRILERMRRLGQMARSRRPIRRGVSRLRSIEEAKRDKGAAWQVRPDL